MSETQAYHRRIASATIVVGLFVLASRIAMLGREVAISWKYGTSQVADAYQIALGLSTWLPMAIVSTCGVVLVPEFVRLQRGAALPRATFFPEVNGAAVAAAVLIAIASAVGLPPIAALMTSSLSVTTRATAVTMTWQVAPVAGMTILGGVLACRLMARERQVNTLLEAVPAVAICAAVLAWHAEARGSDLVLGLVLGSAVQLLWLGVLVARDPDGLARPQLRFASERWRPVWHAMSVMFFGQIVMTVVTPLEQVFAARLGEGAVAVLGYANRIFTLIASAGALAISRGVLPVLTDVRASAEATRAREIAMRWAWLMGAAGVVVMLVGWVAAPYAVVLLFERGAFGREESVAVTETVRWGLVQFPFYFAGIVLVQLLVVVGRYRALAVMAAGNLAVKVACTYLLGVTFGVPGIALATGVMYAFSCASLAYAATAATSDRTP